MDFRALAAASSLIVAAIFLFCFANHCCCLLSPANMDIKMELPFPGEMVDGKLSVVFLNM